MRASRAGTARPGAALALAAVALVAASLAAIGSAKDPTVRLVGKPATLVAGRSWVARLVVRPAPPRPPTLVASSGGRTLAFAARRAGAGRYAAAVRLPSAGAWSLRVRVGARSYRLGRVAVRPRAPSPPVADVVEPFAVAASASGVLVADRAANRVVLVDPATGRTTPVAGSGETGYSGDGGPATQAAVGAPIDVAVGPGGAVYVVHGMWVRRVDAATGTISTVAGTGERAHSGDGGPARLAALNAPDSVDFDARGNLYLAEYENRIRRIDAVTGVITTVAGTGEEGFSGDGGQAAQARLSHPHGLAVSADGTIFVADTWNQRVRRVDGATGVITTVAGSGEEGFAGDGRPAPAARFDDPIGVGLGPDGSVYVVDGSNHAVRRVGTDGILRRVAGTGSPGGSGDGGPATSARMSLPNDVDVTPDGTFYVAEFQGRRVRRVEGATGRISTVAR